MEKEKKTNKIKNIRRYWLEFISHFKKTTSKYHWNKVIDGVPQNYDGQDLVLIQYREKDTKYICIPKVAEYRRDIKMWREENDDYDNVESPYGDKGIQYEVIAWMKIPTYKEALNVG